MRLVTGARYYSSTDYRNLFLPLAFCLGGENCPFHKVLLLTTAFVLAVERVHFYCCSGTDLYLTRGKFVWPCWPVTLCFGCFFCFVFTMASAFVVLFVVPTSHKPATHLPLSNCHLLKLKTADPPHLFILARDSHCKMFPGCSYLII